MNIGKRERGDKGNERKLTWPKEGHKQKNKLFSAAKMSHYIESYLAVSMRLADRQVFVVKSLKLHLHLYLHLYFLFQYFFMYWLQFQL